jgi:hypothetical protein
MKKILSFILIVLISTTPFAGKVETVIVEGFGATVESAQANAGKAAVSQVVGMYTVSSSAVENRQLIKDEVLSYSNGYIKTFQVIDTKKESGLYIVEAKVEVELGKLTQILGKLNIALKNVGNIDFKVKTKQAFSSTNNFKKMVDEIVLNPIIIDQSAYSLYIHSIEPFDEELFDRKAGYEFRYPSGDEKDYKNGDLLPFIIKFKAGLSQEYFESVKEFYEKTSVKTYNNCKVKNIFCLYKLGSNKVGRSSVYEHAKSAGYKFSKNNYRVLENKLKQLEVMKPSFSFKLKDVNGDEIGVISKSRLGYSTGYSSTKILYHQNGSKKWTDSNSVYGSTLAIGLDDDYFISNNKELSVVVLLSESDASQINQIELAINWE